MTIAGTHASRSTLLQLEQHDSRRTLSEQRERARRLHGNLHTSVARRIVCYSRPNEGDSGIACGGEARYAAQCCQALPLPKPRPASADWALQTARSWCPSSMIVPVFALLVAHVVS